MNVAMEMTLRPTRILSWLRLLVVVYLLSVSEFSNAQSVLLDKQIKFDSGAVNVQTYSSKDGARIFIEMDQFKDSIKTRKGDKAIARFISKEIKEQLQKKFPDVSNLNRIQEFADIYSKLAVERIPGSNKATKVEQLTIEDYSISKYQNGKNREFYFTPLDLSEQSVLAVFKKNGTYQFNESVRSHPIVKNHFAELMRFIRKDAAITPPEFSYDKGLLILNKGADTIKIEIDVQQAEAWFGKERIAEGKPIGSLQEHQQSPGRPLQESPSPTTKEATKNQEIALVPPEKIKCNDKLEFELSALTTVRGTVDSFQLEMNTINARKRITLPTGTGELAFRREVKTQLVKDSCGLTIDSTLTLFYVKLSEKLVARKKELEDKAAKEEVQKFKDSITKSVDDRIAALSAEKDYAVSLTAHKSIPIYFSSNDPGNGPQQQDGLTNGDNSIEVDSIVMRISNNTIYQLDVVGKVNGKPIQMLSNDGYGLSLRNLMEGNQRLYFYLDDQKYFFRYKDLFIARPPPGNATSYEIRDAVYHFKPGTAVLLDQKRLIDYLSASAFIDLLAFNSENTNKNLVTELYFNYHINPRNLWKGIGIFKNGYLPVSFGVNLFKEGQGMETFRRKEIIAIDSSESPFDTTTANRYYFKNLDLLRNGFLKIKPMVNILAIDAKKIRSIFELNFGYLLMGSNARLSDPSKGVDSIFTRAIYSYSWASEARIRLNPRPSFGFDLHVMYSFGLRPFGTEFQSVTGDYGIKDLGKANLLNENEDDFILGELNIFFNPKKQKSDSDKGGLYFKLNWYKSMHLRDGHFMFLVGYSTDIKNFFR